jgi:hypothetical protein
MCPFIKFVFEFWSNGIAGEEYVPRIRFERRVKEYPAPSLRYPKRECVYRSIGPTIAKPL